VPEILEPIGNRRARRALSDEPIDREMIEEILAAAHLAPSCANNQPWRFVVVDTPDTLATVKAGLLKGNYWAAPSPVIVALASHADLDCQLPDGREYYTFGCGMAAMNLMVQATARGLIAHPIAGFRQMLVKEALGIPESYQLITLIIIGKPIHDTSALSEKHRAEETSDRVRRPLYEVVSWNRFAFSSRGDER
jgi:nitroreductase